MLLSRMISVTFLCLLLFLASKTSLPRRTKEDISVNKNKKGIRQIHKNWFLFMGACGGGIIYINTDDFLVRSALVLQSGCAMAAGYVNVVGFFKLAGFLGRVFVG